MCSFVVANILVGMRNRACNYFFLGNKHGKPNGQHLACSAGCAPGPRTGHHPTDTSAWFCAVSLYVGEFVSIPDATRETKAVLWARLSCEWSCQWSSSVASQAKHSSHAGSPLAWRYQAHVSTRKRCTMQGLCCCRYAQHRVCVQPCDGSHSWSQQGCWVYHPRSLLKVQWLNQSFSLSTTQKLFFIAFWKKKTANKQEQNNHADPFS